MSKIKIALLTGGISGEREISLKTGEKIYNSLDKSKYEITKYDPKTELGRFLNDALDKKFDLAFPALHGPFGEDGKLQGMLELIGMPYVFSGTLASSLAMDKYKAKLVAKAVGLDTADDLPVDRKNIFMWEEIVDQLSLPIVIKPCESGSSVGVSIVKTEQELKKGIENALKYDDKLILEKYIKGRELTVAIMGKDEPEALPVIEIIPKISQWFDHKAKYEAGGSQEICPAQIPDYIKNRVQQDAIKIFHTLGCKDLARADFIWDENNDKIYFLEINTIPGMTETSLAPQAAKAAGLEFVQLLDKLIEMNLK